MGNPGNPRVFFDVSIGKRPIGRIVFEVSDSLQEDQERFSFLNLYSEEQGLQSTMLLLWPRYPPVLC